jgi:hypothetical protein
MRELQKMDSDAPVGITGKVLSLLRGRADCRYRDDLVYGVMTMVVEHKEDEREISGKRYNLELPIPTKNAFELMPYQSVLVGQTVKYTKEFMPFRLGGGTVIQLDVLSGILKGESYKY